MTEPKSLKPKKLTWIYPTIIVSSVLIVLAGTINRFFSKPFIRPGQPLQATWSINKPAVYYVGDLIPVTLTITATRDVSYRFPDLRSNLGRLELKEVGRIITQRRQGGSIKRRSFLLCGWEPGKHHLKGVTINYRDPAGRQKVYRIPSFQIEIQSLLPKNKSKSELLLLAIKEPKKPLRYPANFTLIGWALAGLAVLSGGYLLVRRLLYRTKDSPTGTTGAEPVITESADCIANRRLDALAKAGYLEAGRFKEYYSELSECAREYLENRFQIRALEMTTEEFLNRAAAADQLSPEHQTLLQTFLQGADLVKFAQSIPNPAEAEADLNRIRSLVAATRDQQPAVPESLAPVAAANQKNNASEIAAEIQE
ncbi:MAG TPA: hypothetical protein VIM29_04545 [Bacillota bacterium]